ncbi:hypothetical protein AWC38_SpisGene23904 [Stylophora pistillata]|uniref:Uncharacterized protein n=1 Tax=Stylophora pistillata TaxID=50429 RepID=A0A2B4R4U4_STYPI|nr:hypothetical protein AWC38_SpisGene23904 [Stylophora pistillata]
MSDETMSDETVPDDIVVKAVPLTLNSFAIKKEDVLLRNNIQRLPFEIRLYILYFLLHTTMQKFLTLDDLMYFIEDMPSQHTDTLVNLWNKRQIERKKELFRNVHKHLTVILEYRKNSNNRFLAFLRPCDNDDRDCTCHFDETHFITLNTSEDGLWYSLHIADESCIALVFSIVIVIVMMKNYSSCQYIMKTSLLLFIALFAHLCWGSINRHPSTTLTPLFLNESMSRRILTSLKSSKSQPLLADYMNSTFGKELTPGAKTTKEGFEKIIQKLMEKAKNNPEMLAIARQNEALDRQMNRKPPTPKRKKVKKGKNPKFNIMNFVKGPKMGPAKKKSGVKKKKKTQTTAERRTPKGRKRKRPRKRGRKPGRKMRQQGGILPLAALIPALIAGGKAIGLGALGGAAGFGVNQALKEAV